VPQAKIEDLTDDLRRVALDICEIQEALVDYLDKHPNELGDLRDRLEALTSRVHSRLKRRPKIIEIIENTDIYNTEEPQKYYEALREVRKYDWDLEWTFHEIRSREEEAYSEYDRLGELTGCVPEGTEYDRLRGLGNAAEHLIYNHRR